MRSLLRSGAATAALLSLSAVALAAQQQAGAATADPTTRTRVPESAYSRWETMGQSALSPDGKWVAYDYRSGAGAAELHYRQTAAGDEHVVRAGSGETFSANGHWLIYTQGRDTTGGGGRGGRGGGAAGGRGAGRGGAGAVSAADRRNSAAIVDLRTGTTTLFGEVQSFSLNKPGTHVVLRRYGGDSASRATDIVVRDLEAGTSLLVGNVAEFAWSDDGKSLAMVMDVGGHTGNGVQLLDVATMAQKTLDEADATYSGLQWREKSNDLAVLRSRNDTAFADTSYAVVAIRDASAKPVKSVYDFSTDVKFPKDMRVAPYRGVQWSEDGSTVFFGIASHEWKPQPPAGGRAAQPARVEVWHWKDLREYHTQAVQGAQDRTRTFLTAWKVGSPSAVALAHDLYENVQLSPNRKAALAIDEDPYFTEVISGRTYRDIYQVDIATGTRTKLLTKAAGNATFSPSGKYVAYSQGGAWWSADLASGAKTNLTSKVKSVFVDMEDDHPVAERRAYGFGGWTTGEQSVLLYDRFDVWQVGVDGSNPTRLTKGREDSTVYRVVRLDDEPGAGGGRGGGRGGAGGGDRTIDPSKPITFSMTGDYTQKSGYARLVPGQGVQRLVFADKGISRLAKAKDADVSMFLQQSYEDSPNLWLATGPLDGAKQLSHINAFQGEYLWGKQVLMPYTNKRGDKLQMMLTYPADYVPGKKYPMVVYYYEKLSDTFHNYVIPTDRSTYNTTVFSQEGYFVLRPDILFKARDPGYSGLDCVTAAVKAALATGMIDPAKVGNFGHSWGGYQSAFYAVHGKGVFAASIAGAPLTDLVSMYGYSSGNTGAPETGHFETGQERMDTPLWKDPAAYIRNSTVFATDSLQIPLLIEIGDADGNVNPSQGMELYNFGRRLGKNVVLLVYNDENHSVARPESQLDYHKRQIEWFAHYLKGEPAADWIVNGETYLSRQKILKDAGAGSATGRGGRPPSP